MNHRQFKNLVNIKIHSYKGEMLYAINSTGTNFETSRNLACLLNSMKRTNIQFIFIIMMKTHLQCDITKITARSSEKWTVFKYLKKM